MMTGYCPDCGNQLCICKSVFANMEDQIADLEAKLALAVDTLKKAIPFVSIKWVAEDFEKVLEKINGD